ncbi:MAG: flagellar biosynthetic protein FliO [Lachnospiraceae bacterium]|nr:flagellar biosynthetic protein FliO [Lachnospiraceae bacterium]
MPAAGMGAVNRVSELITVLIIFVLVLALTLLVTKWLAGYQKGQRSGSNIEIVDTCPAGNGKYIQIVRLGETYVAVAVCKDSVTLLATVPKEQLVLPEAGGSSTLKFRELFHKARAAYPDAEQADGEKAAGEETDGQELPKEE